MPKPIDVRRSQLVVSKVLNYVERNVAATHDGQCFSAPARHRDSEIRSASGGA